MRVPLPAARTTIARGVWLAVMVTRNATKCLPFPEGRGIGAGMTDFPFQVVGFDLDGTLLDTHADLGQAVNHALAQIGRPAIPVAEVRDLIGGGAKQMLNRALTITGGLPADA